jgi:Ran GTPase-activating protein (RanGAP) involved in mRNA processing and transport
MMDETAKILTERMKDMKKTHTVCLSGKNIGKEAKEKENQWNLISNNGGSRLGISDLYI